MPDHLRPSAVPRRRAVMLALLLLVLAALGAAATGIARADGSTTPGPGWVRARLTIFFPWPTAAGLPQSSLFVIGVRR
jgi:hypothetical protein